jgi:hypothetical protein
LDGDNGGCKCCCCCCATAAAAATAAACCCNLDVDEINSLNLVLFVYKSSYDSCFTPEPLLPALALAVEPDETTLCDVVDAGAILTGCCCCLLNGLFAFMAFERW